MNKSIFLAIFLTLGALSAALPHHFLEGKLPRDNGRYKTFHAALELMNQRQPIVIVETGTERWREVENCYDGDGGGTMIFGHWAQENGAKLYSVDIDPTHVKYSIANTKKFGDSVSVVLSDSVEFLRNFDGQIDFLYLDSYDYSEKNPDPAQQHCLREVKAAEDKLHRGSVVMIDDCNIPGGGKGLLAIRYLRAAGWKLHRNYHQVILVQE